MHRLNPVVDNRVEVETMYHKEPTCQLYPQRYYD